MKVIRQPIYCFVIFAILLVFFQNCSFSRFASETAELSSLLDKTESHGNAGSYDGKPKDYERLVPGYNCPEQKSKYASLEINNQTATVITYNANSCHSDIQNVSIRELEVSLFSSKYVGYKNGLYTHFEKALPATDNQTFTEAWCQHLAGDGVPSFEIGIEWQQAGQRAQSSYYSDKNKSAIEVSVVRKIDIDRVVYGSSQSSLEIRLAPRIPDSYKAQGTYSGIFNGQALSVPVVCRMGGQFDPEAPKFDYADNFKTIQIGSAVTDLKPSIEKPAVRYNLDTPLPQGLTFNSLDGSIAGYPILPQVRKTYSVTAVFEFGEITRVLSIGVGSTTIVNNTLALKAAIDQANANAPNPAVIQLLDTEYQWIDSEFSINGDIEIRGQGEGTLLNAKNISRHFSVQKGAYFSLQNLTLKNGNAKFGGSIYSKNAQLHTRKVMFADNQALEPKGTATTGQGGALFADGGDLFIYDSQFINNQTPKSGQALGGGGIYFQSGNSLLIRRSQFRNNKSGRGGALYIDLGANNIFEVSDSLFIGNQAVFAGAIFMGSGKLKITSSNFESNSADYQGGAIYSLGSERIWAEKSNFLQNISPTGSALAVDGIPLQSFFFLLESQVIGNLLVPSFQDYFPTSRGSAFFMSRGNILIRGSTFRSNENQANCALLFPSLGSIGSLGGNASDDSTCPL